MAAKRHLGLFSAALLLLVTLGAMLRHAVPVLAQKQDISAYVGQYREVAEPDTVWSIAVKDDQLMLESPRQYPVPLTSEGADKFVAQDLAAHLTMQRDAQGKVIGWHRISYEPRFTTMGDAARISTTPVHTELIPYRRSEVMIPMRDGVKLHAVILRPEKQDAPLPILIERSPYGVDGNNSDNLNGRKPEMVRRGYIFVYEDIRGCFKSEGQFVMNRPIVHAMGERKDPAKVDESSDAYDTVDWLVKNLPGNNGRAGVLGVSYLGFTAMMAGIDPHPAVKAISPQAPMTDVWMGDDFFHNGAFRQTYGYDYTLRMEGQHIKHEAPPADYYEYLLHEGNFANAAKQAGVDKLPTGRAFIEHPSYDEFWRAMAVQPWLTKITVPTFEVGGWWDQEDMWGTLAEYAALHAHEHPGDPELRLMLGPWIHGQWAGKTTRFLGALNFNSPTTEHFRQAEFDFFERYLRPGTAAGKPAPPVQSFQTGSNTWKSYAAWPPANAQSRQLYLGAKGALSFTAPAGDVTTNYVSDPAHPVPYREDAVLPTYGAGSHWYTWLAADQRFATKRADVAVWQTPVLDAPLTVTGDVKADLFAATTGSDGDFVVKLIDVYPNDAPEGMGGYQLMIAEEIFRGRYRESFSTPQEITPGAVEEYTWSLNAVDHVFLKGHRVMVTVQSSWFPLYDRNPQSFTPNIMTAPPSAYRKATISIVAPSNLELPVVQSK